MEALTAGGSMARSGQVPDDFDAWARPHLPVLHRYAARLVGPADADDVLQEALVRAWRRRSTYDERRGTPLPWLIAIVRDRAGRHRTRRRDHLELAAADGPAAARDPDLDLERAIRALPPRQREAVDLYYFVDLDVAAIAAVMGCAPGTVRATLHQARAALRAQIGDDHE
ncbi:RNA polymerase sigma factor [Nocardioides humilatus]|nr:RNA polymerase sigma factor [Nocardioides humilatus]